MSDKAIFVVNNMWTDAVNRREVFEGFLDTLKENNVNEFDMQWFISTMNPVLGFILRGGRHLDNAYEYLSPIREKFLHKDLRERVELEFKVPDAGLQTAYIIQQQDIKYLTDSFSKDIIEAVSKVDDFEKLKGYLLNQLESFNLDDETKLDPYASDLFNISGLVNFSTNNDLFKQDSNMTVIVMDNIKQPYEDHRIVD